MCKNESVPAVLKKITKYFVLQLFHVVLKYGPIRNSQKSSLWSEWLVTHAVLRQRYIVLEVVNYLNYTIAIFRFIFTVSYRIE